jgi:two-component system sensor histidine kinase and response regulator WspE
MSGETFTDASMLEIFRAEVETHVEALTSGLLSLERDPKDTSHIDEMMRGAHSIKGAARIVGIDPAVHVAHVMEDGFIAAQNGKLTLRPDHVDVLLRGVDILNRMATASKDPGIDWGGFASEATPLVAEITAVLNGTPESATTAKKLAADPHKPTVVASVAEIPARSVQEIAIAIPAVLNATAAEIARQEFIAGIDAKTKVVRFDLSQTSDLDATGLAFLAAVPATAIQEGVRAELTGASSDLRYVLEVTGIDKLYSSGGP